MLGFEVAVDRAKLVTITETTQNLPPAPRNHFRSEIAHGNITRMHVSVHYDSC